MMDRRQAGWAAIPPLLVGVGVAAVTALLMIVDGPAELGATLGTGLPHTLAMVGAILLLAVLCASAGTGAAGRLPAWAYTWVAADIAALVGTLNLVAEDRPFVFGPVADVLLLVMLLLSGLMVVVAAAIKGWDHAGLLGLGACAALSLSLCFWAAAGPFRVDIGLAAAPAGLLLSGNTYLFARSATAGRVSALAIAAATSAGLSWAVDAAFQTWAAFSGSPRMFWPMLALSTGPLVVGPLLGLAAQRLRHAIGQRSTRG
jgi:hypothetical protein